MTIKDFCRFAWEENTVVRFPKYEVVDIGGYVDTWEDIRNHPLRVVYSNTERDYDYLKIDWNKVDYNLSLQEIGKQLYKEYALY